MKKSFAFQIRPIVLAEVIISLAILAALLHPTKIWAGPTADKSNVSLPLPTDLLLSLIDSESNAADPEVTHFGPIASTSPDSSTCGNDWAEDSFNRFFTIKATTDPRTFRVYERFKDGSFVTNSGPSPGACDTTDGTPPGALINGIRGSFDGYILTNVTCDPLVAVCPIATASCEASTACDTTDDFIQTFFGTNAVRNDVAFFFHYSGSGQNNQALVEQEWKNASTNRGGNHGDIASCFVAVAGGTCP